MSKEFQFNPKAVTTTYCAALHNDRACLAIRIVDEVGDTIERQFSCKHFQIKLERVDTFLGRRRVQICKRCPQCKQQNVGPVEADFDEVQLRRGQEE